MITPLVGNITTPDGVEHPEAIAWIYKVSVNNDPVEANRNAEVEVRIYHNVLTFSQGLQPIYLYRYFFDNTGKSHSFNDIFNPNQDSQQMLFDYIKNLPELKDWNSLS